MPTGHQKPGYAPLCYSIMQQRRIRSCLLWRIFDSTTFGVFTFYLRRLLFFTGVCILWELGVFHRIVQIHWILVTTQTLVHYDEYTVCSYLESLNKWVMTCRSHCAKMPSILFYRPQPWPQPWPCFYFPFGYISFIRLWFFGCWDSYWVMHPPNTFGSMYKTDHHIWRSHSILFPSCKFHNCLFCFVSLFFPTLSWNDFSVTNEWEFLLHKQEM